MHVRGQTHLHMNNIFRQSYMSMYIHTHMLTAVNSSWLSIW